MKFESITMHPRHLNGAPCIRSSRITVHAVLHKLAEGISTEEILGEFPELTGPDISAALRYAAETVRAYEWVPADS